MRLDTEQLFIRACEQANLREPSPVAFELSELFPRTEWKKLTPDIRRDLGREFSYAVSKGSIKGLHFAGENAKHHNTYIKS